MDCNWNAGTCVTVDGRPLTEFLAKMQSYPRFSKQLDTEIFQGRQRTTLVPLRSLVSGMFMKARVDFFGSNSTRTRNQSAFEAVFLSKLDPVRIDILDGFWYNAVLVSIQETSTDHELITTVEYCWRVTRHKDPVQVDFAFGTHASDAVIWCESNVQKTDCCITIQIYQSANDIRVCLNDLEWTIHLLNTRTELVLDGINKQVLLSGNHVNDYDSFLEFPYLVPGENELTLYDKTSEHPNAWGNPISVGRSVVFTPTFF